MNNPINQYTNKTNSQLKTSTKFIGHWFNAKYQALLIGLFVILVYFLFSIPASAQTLDPTSWQTGATGMKTQINAKKNTAGLGFIVSDKSGPFLSTQGGVSDGGWNKLQGPIGIDLGSIKTSSTAPTFSTESVDWASNEMTFNGGTPTELKVLLSRLTPQVMIQTPSSFLRLLSGNLFTTSTTYPTNPNCSGACVTNKTAGPAYPKYVAYSSGGVIQVKQLSTTALSLPTLDNNWLLVWYGNNSHFIDTKTPIVYPFPRKLTCCDLLTAVIAHKEAYQADIPMLLTFQNKPTSIVHSTEGGIDLNFASGAGFTGVTPILGRDHLKASDTEGWGTSLSLPQNVKNVINFWTARSCQFPKTASESYGYNAGTDTATITQTTTFLPVCTFSSTRFAPIPSYLAVAKDSIGTNLTFSGSLVDANTPTDFGPLLGIDNVSQFNWSLKGLNKYINFQRPVGQGQVPSDIMQELTKQVDRIIADGHYAPWIFGDRMVSWNGARTGNIYFNNPGEIITLLTEIIPVLPEPQKTNLTNYLKSERANYPPETVFDLVLDQGTQRESFSLPNQSWGGPGTVHNAWKTLRLDEHYTRVPLYNFYALARYYKLTGEAVPTLVLSAGKTAINNDLKEQDFATNYWFKGFENRPIEAAVSSGNIHAAGLIGMTYLSNRLGDTSTENLSRGLLAKALVNRIAMAKYPRYLYSANLITLPTDPAFEVKNYSGALSFGRIFNYNWTGPLEDPRQVASLDQFGVLLYDNSGFNHPLVNSNGNFENYDWIVRAGLSIFDGISPEVLLALKDYAKADTEVNFKKYETIMPHWYMAFSEGFLGTEHDLARAIDSYQIFLGKSWLQDETPDNLARFASIPFTQNGDFYYVHKLAETARAYAATGSPPPSTQPSPSAGKVGDISGITGSPDNKVDIWDYNLMLTDLGKSGTNLVSDIEKFGISLNKVDIFDYNLLLTNFGT